MSSIEEFVPAQGRNVVYAFRNPNVWVSHGASLKRAEGVHPDVPSFIYRPAQIVRVWVNTGMKTVNLVVFLDGSNDSSLGGAADKLTLWKTSAVIQTPEMAEIGAEGYLPRIPADARLGS